mmetsp:Transcript_7177/g.26394  ORF Transcript_7177/g.26394 Transcript_7177/m.26394 type:complete len:93 (-) Transcript_7177:4749-5027(-)
MWTLYRLQHPISIIRASWLCWVLHRIHIHFCGSADSIPSMGPIGSLPCHSLGLKELLMNKAKGKDANEACGNFHGGAMKGKQDSWLRMARSL